MIGRYRDGVVPDVDVDPALAADFDGLVDEVCELLDRAEITQALERIWQRVRRLNRYVEEQAPWQLAKDEREGGRARHRAALARRGPARGHGAAAPVHARDGGEAARRARARASSRSSGAAFGARPGGGDASASSRRCSRSRSDRQPHAPRLARPGTDAEIVAAARAAGVTRILTIGTDAESSRRAQAAAEAHDEVWFAVGHHPNSATGFTDAITDELRELARHPRCAAIGETGLDDYRDYAPRADQERAFAAHIGLARELGKPLVIHTRAADDDTIATLARDAQGLDVILHCFSMPDRLDECLDARLVDLVRRQRHLPEGARARATRPSRRRSTACSSRPTRRTSRRRRCARSATSRPTSSTPRASSPSGAGIAYEELEAAVARQQRAACSAGERASRSSRACGG